MPLGTLEMEGGWWKSTPIVFLILDLKRKVKRKFFLGVISLRRVVVPSPKLVINLPRTYEKLHCKGEPYHTIQ